MQEEWGEIPSPPTPPCVNSLCLFWGRVTLISVKEGWLIPQTCCTAGVPNPWGHGSVTVCGLSGTMLHGRKWAASEQSFIFRSPSLALLPEPSPPPSSPTPRNRSVENLSSMTPVPRAKKGGDHCCTVWLPGTLSSGHWNWLHVLRPYLKYTLKHSLSHQNSVFQPGNYLWNMFSFKNPIFPHRTWHKVI